MSTWIDSIERRWRFSRMTGSWEVEVQTGVWRQSQLPPEGLRRITGSVPTPGTVIVETMGPPGPPGPPGPSGATIDTVPGLREELDEKEPLIGSGTINDYYRGDKLFRPLNKDAVGLSNVDNTSDLNKPISSAAQAALDAKSNDDHTHAQNEITGLVTDLAGKEPTITAGTTAQYWRGDKTWQTLNKSAVGLGNADNTSDANKPISTAAQAALDVKQPLDSDLTDIAGLAPSDNNVLQRKSGAWTHRTPAQLKTDLSLVKGDVGLSNVDNTSDVNKPVSTAQQAALDLKADDNEVVKLTGDQDIAGEKTFTEDFRVGAAFVVQATAPTDSFVIYNGANDVNQDTYFNTHGVKNIGDPEDYTDAAHKGYVDDGLALKENTANKGVNNGYASLDGAGKVPWTQLPASIMIYRGVWNANTNTPTLVDGVGTQGDVWRVTVAGSRNLGSGTISFGVGDYATYNGTAWEKSDSTDAVTSVAGLSGTIAASALTDALTDGSVNHVFTVADDTKLASIETGADVTDAANVDAAGAVMNSDTSTAAMNFVVDEDNMASNSATKVSTQQSVKAYVDTADALKAPLASPTFTGTVSGITKTMVGLGNVDNTSDADKPVSTTQQTALDLKANIASPTFTGTVSGITKTMVGLGNVDNTSDAAKPVSTATQTALDAKAADNAVVKLTGDQTVAGNKTFSDNIVADTLRTTGLRDFAEGALTLDLESAGGSISNDFVRVTSSFNSGAGIAAVGANTDIDLNLNSKGAGDVLINGDPAVTSLADLGITSTAAELNHVDGVTSAIQTQLDGKVDENSAITGATKTKITYDAKGLVTAGADATTADIADSSNKRYVTDAQLTVIGNTSGTNTGDQSTIVGITGTKAQFNTAVTDGDIVYTDNAALTDTRTPTDGSVTTAKFAASALVTAAEGLASSDNDTSVPTVAAAKAYTDSVASSGIPGLTASAAELNILDGATLSTAELNYVDGVTSAIQTQIDGKQASDADLTAIAGLSPTDDDVLQRKAGAWTNRTVAQLKTDLALNNVDNTSNATERAAAATLTNKTIDLTSNTLVGSVTEFNTALESADFYTTGGTDVAVADGGTGVSTLTGIVKGNGTSAFSAAAAGTDYVAPGGALGTPSSGTLTNATGLPISGLVASTSTALGVGSVELGHASDTTIARASAGQITVEGTAVLLSGGALGTPSSATLTNATGLPVAGITASTSTALGVGSVELGHASDTTLSRSSAGQLAVEGVVVVTASNTLSISNKTLTNPTITNYTETYYNGGNTSTAATIDLANGTFQKWTLTGNCTFTMPTATAGKSFMVHLFTGAGGFTGTFTGVKWSGGTTPTVTTTASRLDKFAFDSDGTNWYGSVSPNYTP